MMLLTSKIQKKQSPKLVSKLSPVMGSTSNYKVCNKNKDDDDTAGIEDSEIK